METPEFIMASVIPGEWVASIDLSDAYLHIPIKKIKTKTTQTHSGVFVCGLRIPSRFGPCKTHSREMVQTSGFDPMLKVKTCFDCKMFDATNWVACLNGKDGPEGMPSHETLSVSSQVALEISSVVEHLHFVVGDLFSTSRVVGESRKWDHLYLHPSPQDHSIQIFSEASKEGWGAHLEQSLQKVCGQTGKKDYT